jgi:prophage antirepressor-like protein
MIDNQILVYDNGEIELKVSIESDTVWLTQKDLSKLFEKDQSVVSRHINNIFKDKEVDEKSNMQFLHIASSDKPVKFYSLDIVLAVGYRASSAKAIKFRQWATKVLKQYIHNGYAINSEKITHERFKELEDDVFSIKQKVNKIDKLIISNKVDITQGIFYDGEIFDAYIFSTKLMKSAKREIILVDNYIDDTILTMFSKYPDIKFKIITKSISKQLKLDIDKYNKQYKNLEIKISNKYHDRFLIIDKKEAYHIGASLKDLGKKVFGFNKIDIKLLMDEL